MVNTEVNEAKFKMLKNQSIKSFFTSANNSKQNTKNEEEKKDKEDEIKQTKNSPEKNELEKVGKSKSATPKGKKANASKEADSKMNISTNSDDSSSEVEKYSSKPSDKTKKRKLVLESSESESEKENQKDTPSSIKSEKMNIKSDQDSKSSLNEAENDDEVIEVTEATKKPPKEEKKNLSKKKREASPKSKEKASSTKVAAHSSKVTAKKSLSPKSSHVKKSQSEPSSDEESPDKAKMKMLEVEKKKAESTTATTTTYSKSTSNFFDGKKLKSNTMCLNDSEASKTNEYSPAKDNYHPVKDAMWEKDEPVPYKALAQTLYCMEKTTKRLELLSIVSNYFRSLIALSPNDLVPSIYILTNKVAPDYENIELGIGDTILFKALAEATGCTLAKLKTEFQNKGDIGLVAEANRCNQKLIFKPKKLTVSACFNKLKEIAAITGNASQSKKTDLIKGLLVSCDPVEARYLMRSLAGKLRNGLGEQSILACLGQAFATTYIKDDELVVDEFKKLRKNEQIDDIKKALEKPVQAVKQAYYQCPNYALVIDAILKHGLDDLEEHCKLTPGIPLKPMLAYPTKGIHEVLKRFEEAELACEYKYDGERAQIHIMEDGNIKIYSRNSENNTSKYPDVIEFLIQHLHLKKNKTAKKSEQETKTEETEESEPKLKVTSAIIDAEVVAYDIEKHIIQPFQKLSTRKRKDAASEEIKVQVCLFAFDLLYLNGDALIKLPFRERRQQLYDYFPRVESKLMYAEKLDTNSTDSIQEFLDKSIKDSCEGLMIKTLDENAHYEISKRSHNWLKLKKDYLEGVGDTLDLVPIGGYFGSGKRTGVYGGYLLACYDQENEEYQSICKMGVGLKDNDLQTLFESLSKHKIDKPKSYYHISSDVEQPDDWFEPVQVWELKCADFSLSPVHTAALGLIESEKGISMRFPRFLRVRDDKKPEDATSSEQVVDMFKNQQQMINQADKPKSDDEDE